MISFMFWGLKVPLMIMLGQEVRPTGDRANG